MTTDTSALREKIRETVDDSVLTHTGRSIGDLSSQSVADDLMVILKSELTRQREEMLDELEKFINDYDNRPMTVHGWIASQRQKESSSNNNER